MKTYMGRRYQDETVVTVQEDGGPIHSLPLRLEVRNHSPTGFEWGYGGSGPAQLALAILCDFFGDNVMAQQYYQDFKWKAISPIKADLWVYTGAQIARILSEIDRENGSRAEGGDDGED